MASKGHIGKSRETMDSPPPVGGAEVRGATPATSTPASPTQAASTTTSGPAAQPRAWIAVIGTGEESLGSEVYPWCQAVGKLLATAQFGLQTGGWPGVDRQTATAYHDAGGGHLRHYLEPSQEAPSMPGETSRVENYFATLAECKAVIVIGANGGGQNAYKEWGERIPFLPLPRSGGDAVVLFKEMTARYQGHEVLDFPYAPVTWHDLSLLNTMEVGDLANLQQLLAKVIQTRRTEFGLSSDWIPESNSFKTWDDQLDRLPEIDAFATLLAARKLPLPLSIGIFGEWGSGKSFFMRAMLSRIEAFKKSGDEKLCSSIVQIEFNAWQYMDSNLWASLTQHIFARLAGSDEAKELFPKVVKENLTKDLVEAESKETAAKKSLDAKKQSLELDLKSAQESQSLAARKLVDTLSNQGFPIKAEDSQFKDFDHLLQLARTSLSFSGLTRASFTELALLLMSVILVCVCSRYSPPWLGALLPNLVAASGSFLAAASVVKKSGDVQLRLIKLQETTLTVQELEKSTEKVRNRLKEFQDGVMPPIDALKIYAESRFESQDYRKHLGLLSIVRNDLQVLADRLSPPPASNEKAAVDRIILYVDDLDRCPPERVVEVLQAVHLLLAMPLFVVVVGVDAQWLAQSLLTHYRSMLKSEVDGDSAEHFSNPHQYLEKIFQIPYRLPPVTQKGVQSMLTALFPGVRPSRKAGRSPVAGNDPVLPSNGKGQQTMVDELPGVAAWSALSMEPEEASFLGGLTALLSRRPPRSIKRFANTYRILRGTVRPENLKTYLEKQDYEIVLFLLAISIGLPKLWPVVSQLIQDADGGTLRQALTGPPDTFKGCADEAELLQDWLLQTSNFSPDVLRFKDPAATVSRYCYGLEERRRETERKDAQDSPNGQATAFGRGPKL